MTNSTLITFQSTQQIISKPDYLKELRHKTFSNFSTFPFYVWFCARKRFSAISSSSYPLHVAVLNIAASLNHMCLPKPSYRTKPVFSRSPTRSAKFQTAASSFLRAKRALKPLKKAEPSRIDYALHPSYSWTPEWTRTTSIIGLMGKQPRASSSGQLYPEISELRESNDRSESVRKHLTAANPVVERYTTSKIKTFLTYLRFKQSDLGFEVRCHRPKLHNSRVAIPGTEPSFTTPYFRPYMFLGIKKTPKVLLHDPLNAIFNQLKRFVDTRNSSKTSRIKQLRVSYPHIERIAAVSEGYNQELSPAATLRSFLRKKTLRSFVSEIELRSLRHSNRTLSTLTIRNRNNPLGGLPYKTNFIPSTIPKNNPNVSETLFAQSSLSPYHPLKLFARSDRPVTHTYLTYKFAYKGYVRSRSLDLDEKLLRFRLSTYPKYLVQSLLRSKKLSSFLVSSALLRLLLGTLTQRKFSNIRNSLRRGSAKTKLRLVTRRAKGLTTSRRNFRSRPTSLWMRLFSSPYITTFPQINTLLTQLTKKQFTKLQKTSTRRQVFNYLYLSHNKLQAPELRNSSKSVGKWSSLTALPGGSVNQSLPSLNLPILWKFLVPAKRNVTDFTQTSRFKLLPSSLPTIQPLELRASSSFTTPQSLQLTPLYTTFFTRSAFFFHGLINAKRPTYADLLPTNQNLHPSLNYLVFPDANDVKVSVFRRLNRQKTIFQSRTLALRSRKALHLRNKHYSGILPTIPRNIKLQSDTSPYSSPNLLQMGKDLRFRDMFKEFHRLEMKSTHIKRIRFKPGYGRIWRIARTSVQELLNVYARYQYRLTTKLQQAYNAQNRVAVTHRAGTLTVEFALMTSHFSPDVWATRELMENHSVFLNGLNCWNPNTTLFLGDFIQLTVSLQFYSAARWLKNWSILKQNRINKIFYRKYRPAPFNKNIRIVRKLPHWFFDLQYTYCDIPRHFEIDYFTLSLFVIHDRPNLERWMPTRARLTDPVILNMYNWKYIT